MSRVRLVTAIGTIGLAFLTLSPRTAADDPPQPLSVGGDVQAPELLSKVEPEYPQKAREGGVTGIVVLDTVIDLEGRVTRINVVKSIPLLDQAAIDAVKQWKYKPATQKGQPVEVYLSIALSFPPAGAAADPSKREAAGVGGSGQISQVSGDIVPPELIERVTPEYSESMRRARIQGTVALQATITVDGSVENVIVKRSIPELDDAAIAAVKQWKYRPATKGGRPIPVVIVVTVDFKLK